jgi:uncharacterized protein (TIGR00369 family)
MSKVFQPRHEAFEERVRRSFARQAFMSTLGATLERVQPGTVLIRLPFQKNLTQQHGYLHAGAVAAILDSACGYAALSLAPAKTTVLAVEFKINLLRPAVGRELFAQATVLRSGRTLTVCQGECRADSLETDRIIAVMQSTIMSLEERDGLAEEVEVAQ